MKELLLQKRSKHKITFPSLWTNTVCSHPLAIESEICGVEGVQNAVLRRSIYEFNLELEKADLHFVQRILYFREMDHELLAENELDYCVLSCCDRPFSMNQNEIEDFKFIQFNELATFMVENETTPWFKLIYQSGLLEQWWRELLQDDLKSVTVDPSIRLLK